MSYCDLPPYYAEPFRTCIAAQLAAATSAASPRLETEEQTLAQTERLLAHFRSLLDAERAAQAGVTAGMDLR